MSLTPNRKAITLFQPETTQSVKAELWDMITEKNLIDWENKWNPERDRILEKLKELGEKLPQSSHWSWRKKLQSTRGSSQKFFSIVCDDMTQAMMITDNIQNARLPVQKGKHLVYIGFLEVAPWNRIGIPEEPLNYSGCGTALIREAIEYSKTEEFKGRIGLHSLPQSNDYYANKINMTNMGPDKNYENLCYFEMTPEQAEAFIK